MYDYTRVFAMVHRQSFIHYSKELEAFGLSCGQFMYVLHICENPGSNQEQLSEETRIDKGTVAKMLRQLEDAGFVERRICAEDKRAYSLYPTAKARKVYPQLKAMIDNWHDRVLGCLTDTEKVVLQMLLEKLRLHTDRAGFSCCAETSAGPQSA
ncbi:MAG: MarR family transcriptional regulator [Planctomycetes bacterium]|nr:MarR family transcriptional regulator [Planctomycetota bacterium]